MLACAALGRRGQYLYQYCTNEDSRTPRLGEHYNDHWIPESISSETVGGRAKAGGRKGLARKSSALEILPLDAFCTEFMGHNWGVSAELLWYGGGPFRRVEAMSLGLLHDVPVRPGSDSDIEVASRLWKTFDAFGRQEAAWLPYWGNARFVRTSPAGVKVSLYNRPGRGLIAVVVNAGDRPCDAEVALDLAALEQRTSLKSSTIVVVGALPGDMGKAILDVFRTRVVAARIEPFPVGRRSHPS